MSKKMIRNLKTGNTAYFMCEYNRTTDGKHMYQGMCPYTARMVYWIASNCELEG